MNPTALPLIIDVEASGFGPSSYPIEIGVVLNDGVKFCTLIQPAKGWTHWDKEAENMHGISRDILMTHGQPIDQVADHLNRMLKGMTLFSDGWVVDKTWIATLFHAAARDMQFSVSPLEMILSEQQMAVWHETKDRIIAEMNITRHRASHDAWVIQETFRLTLDMDKG